MISAEISIRRAALILALVAAFPVPIRAAKETAADAGAAAGVGGDVVVRSLSTGKKKRRPLRPNRFDAYAFVSSYYDDNVFDYSDADRARFDAATTSLSRFPISDLSDVVTRVAGRVSYLWKVRRRSNWRARLSYDGRLYANNGDKTYHELGMSLRRKKRRGSFELRVGYTPEYYLRHLFWRASLAPPPGVRYAPATFAKYSVSVRGRRRVARRWALGVFARFARRNYDAPFDERDNSTWTVGAGPEVRVSRRVAVDGGIAMSFSSAQGANSSDPAATDISNDRFKVYAGMNWRISRNVRLEERVGYAHQWYTTGRVADKYHYQRKDDEFWWRNELTMPLRGKVQPKLFFNYRSGATATLPGVADVGQYTGARFGAQLTLFI